MGGMRVFRLILGISVAALAGCGGGDPVCLTPEVGCGSPTAQNTTTVQNVSFNDDLVSGVFSTCGGVAACHGGDGQDGYATDIEAGTRTCNDLYNELLEDRVGESDTGPRLDPAADQADPAGSFYVQKSTNAITHTGGDALGGTDYDLVVQWISEGSVNDCP